MDARFLQTFRIVPLIQNVNHQISVLVGFRLALRILLLPLWRVEIGGHQMTFLSIFLARREGEVSETGAREDTS